MRTLALFDFDGTITTKDTLIEIAKYRKGYLGWVLGMIRLAPVMTLYKIGVIPNWKAKEFFLNFFFGGLKEKEFQNLCDRFSVDRLPALLRPQALKAIRTHKENGDLIIVVSASAVNWLSKWCQSMKLELIATKLEIRDGYLTGRIDGQNCYGDEKAKRVKEKIDLALFDRIYAYGDSAGGDKALFQLATDKKYKVF